MLRMRLAPLGFAISVASLCASCFSTSEGVEPPATGIYFPTALVTSPKGTALYVVNSDFDLQYDAGTIQAIDLARLRAMIPKLWESPYKVDCAKYGLGVNEAVTLIPGPCAAIELDSPPDGRGSLVKNTVKIGAFGADAAMLARPTDEGAPGLRLAVPVRGDPSLTWLDVDDDRVGPQTFRLDCNQASNGNRCANDHLAGIDPAENTRSLAMPNEPFQMAVSDRADAIVITHQTSGAVSLFRNGWGAGAVTNCGTPPSKPTLEFVMGGLPTGASGIAPIPRPAWAKLDYSEGFLVTYRNSPQVDLIRYVDDCASSPARPFLSGPVTSGIVNNASGFDSRSIIVDGSHQRACEATCDAADDACLSTCASVPSQVYLANRSPASLLVGDTTTRANVAGADGAPYLSNQVALTLGPSRVYMGKVIDENGQLVPRVFVLCFDTRYLFVIDPEHLDAVPIAVKTGRGPSALAFDPGIGDDTSPANFAYLAHFTDSYLGVLDLDMRHTETFLSFVAIVGRPSPPRESK